MEKNLTQSGGVVKRRLEKIRSELSLITGSEYNLKKPFTKLQYYPHTDLRPQKTFECSLHRENTSHNYNIDTNNNKFYTSKLNNMSQTRNQKARTFCSSISENKRYDDFNYAPHKGTTTI